MNEKSNGASRRTPRCPSIASVVMMMVVVMVVMMMAGVTRPDANDDTAVVMVVMVVMMMTHLHRNLRDPHSVLRALVLRALRFRKTSIVGL
ncbi:MAG: hypothetical protein WB774_13320 [Xanthobacteraceae bacterium]